MSVGGRDPVRPGRADSRIQAGEEASPHGYPVHKQTNGRTYHFGGVGFTKYYGIETGRSRRFAMRDFDGVYGIDLKEEPVSTRKAKEGKNGRPSG